MSPFPLGKCLLEGLTSVNPGQAYTATMAVMTGPCYRKQNTHFYKIMSSTQTIVIIYLYY